MSRDTNELVVYTRAKYSKTPTNRYGADVVVRNGKVTDIIIGQAGVRIPSDGFVLSGHGDAKNFLLSYAKMGERAMTAEQAAELYG